MFERGFEETTQSVADSQIHRSISAPRHVAGQKKIGRVTYYILVWPLLWRGYRYQNTSNKLLATYKIANGSGFMFKLESTCEPN